MTRPRILLTNDDGIESPGLEAMASALTNVGEVTVMAPHRERSAAGHSMTLHKPLRITKVAERRYMVTGSPVDCVYVGTRGFLEQRPDMVISGPNAGANLGSDAFYSGTVAAAREGALIGIRSYAFSLVDLGQGRSPDERPSYRYDVAGEVASRIVKATLAKPFLGGGFLNINIPNLVLDEIRGFAFTRQGIRVYSCLIEQRVDPRGKPYYWIGGGYEGFEECGDCDCRAVEQKKVSITPLSTDCTHEAFLDTLRREVSLV